MPVYSIQVDQEIERLAMKVYMTLWPGELTPNRAEMISRLFEHFIIEEDLAIGGDPSLGQAIPAADLNKAVEGILSPNISLPLTLRADSAPTGAADREVSQRQWDILYNSLRDSHPTDPWIMKIEAMEDGTATFWKHAIVTVYLAVHDRFQRLDSETWTLIDRTHSMMQKREVSR